MDDYTYKVLDAAYNRMYEEHLKVRSVPNIAERTWERFICRIIKHGDEQEQAINFVEDFALERDTNMIAAIGQGKLKNQFQLFIRSREAVAIVSEMLKIRYQLYLKKLSPSEAMEILLDSHLNLIGLLKHTDISPKPWILTRRIVNMIFDELFTTIADAGELDRVAMILRISENQSDYSKQYKVRLIVNEYLTLRSLSLTRFKKASLAWHVQWISLSQDGN